MFSERIKIRAHDRRTSELLFSPTAVARNILVASMEHCEIDLWSTAWVSVSGGVLLLDTGVRHISGAEYHMLMQHNEHVVCVTQTLGASLNLDPRRRYFPN